MTNISTNIGIYEQDTDRESWNFENIDYVRHTEPAERGEEFELELQLIPVTNYFDRERAIVVATTTNRPLSILPESKTDTWWSLLTDCHSRQEDINVNGCIWTSPEHKRFYASVRIDLPELEEAEECVRDDLFLDDEVAGDEEYEFSTPDNFTNEVVDYTNSVWRERHGMTDDEYEAKAEQTRLRVEQIMSERNQNADEVSTSISPEQRSQALTEYEANRKKGVVAWLLWLFLGALGAHRFYLGNTGYAVAMLLLGWATLGIWPFLDGIICINRNLRAQNQNLWNRLAATYRVPLEPAPESARN